MKQTIQLTLALCLAAIIITVACKKSSNNATGPTQSLNQLFSGLRTTPQNLSVQAGRDTIVFGANGTMLHFYTNTFKDVNGNIITSGTVNLQLTEIYKPGDMVANRAPTTTSNGNLLQSGGEINILATMNLQTVYANKYGIAFIQSNPSTQTMQLFYGNSNSSDSSIAWSICDTSMSGTIAYGTTRDTTHKSQPVNFLYYAFDSCTNFIWTNCDSWCFLGPRINYLHLVFPNNSFRLYGDIGNTMAYLILPSTNNVVDLGSDSSSSDIYIYNGELPPLDSNYEFVAIANINGSYYYYETSGVTTSDMTINAAMAPESQGDIIARLAGL